MIEHYEHVILACLVTIAVLLLMLVTESVIGTAFVLDELVYDRNWHRRNVQYAIPAVCHQAWKSKTEFPPLVAEAMRLTRNNNPHVTFKLYDDDDIVHYIHKHFPGRVYHCFRQLSTDYMPARVDLFRYCVMYREGGIYLDIKSVIFKDIFSYVKPNDVAILDDVRYIEPYRSDMGLGTYEQWMLLYAPGHDYMRRAIDRICDSIEQSCRDGVSYKNAVFGNRLQHDTTTASKEVVLRLTGPDGLANAIHSSILATGPKHRIISYDMFARITLVRDGTDSRSSMNTRTRHYSQNTTPLIVCTSDRADLSGAERS